MVVGIHPSVMGSLNTARLNQTLDVLAHPYRRYVLYYLTRESEVVDIDTLVTAVANCGGNETGTDSSNEVKLSLHHIHLPKLASAGIITFSFDTDTVALGDTIGLDRFLNDTAPIDGYAQINVGD